MLEDFVSIYNTPASRGECLESQITETGSLQMKYMVTEATEHFFDLSILSFPKDDSNDMSLTDILFLFDRNATDMFTVTDEHPFRENAFGIFRKRLVDGHIVFFLMFELGMSESVGEIAIICEED